MPANMMRFIPALHNLYQLLGAALVIAGVLVLFGIGVALMVAGSLALAFGVILERN